jgi:hypothetical protein
VTRTGGVVARHGDDDARGGLDLGALQHVAASAVALDGGDAVVTGVGDVVAVVVDDDDLVAVGAVVEQGAHRAAALGAVADDDGVVAQGGPPTVLPELLAGALGEDLERGADQHDEEQHAQRRDEQDVDRAREVAHRRDVAVAGGGEADRRVVHGVEEADLVVDVAVALAVQPDDGRHREHDGDRDDHALADRPHRTDVGARQQDVGAHPAGGPARRRRRAAARAHVTACLRTGGSVGVRGRCTVAPGRIRCATLQA